MTEVLAPWQRVPLPSSWKLSQPAEGVPAGQHVARYLRQASKAVGAAVARILPGAGSRVPVLDLGPWEAPGSVTPGPAGWFALAVEAGRSGFQLGGRPLTAADLAQAIWHCPRWRGRPVLLVTQRPAPADGAGPILHQLAVDLGAPVYASDSGIRFTFGRAFANGLFWCWRPDGGDDPEPAGRLLPPLGPARARHFPTGGVPGRNGNRQPPSPVSSPPPGPAPPPVTTDPGTAPSLADPAATASPAAAPESGPGMSSGVEAALGVRGLAVPVIEVPRPDLSVRRMVLPEIPPLRLELDTCRPLAAASTVATPTAATSAAAVATIAPAAPATGLDTTDAPANGAGEGPPPTPRADRPGAAWFGVRARTDEADRERLRTVLDWKFQAHSRTVTRALSLHPGLRSAVGTHDMMAGLVAVLALLDGVGERVNGALRGGGTPDEDVQLLARCGCAGLAQLPAIGGPVFAAVPAGLDVTGRYRPGELLVEPAFTAVSVDGGTEGGAGRYAIWSATARRLDHLGVPGGPGAQAGQAMFAAGTRFAVLGVDEGPDGAPCVLLREIVFGHHERRLDERVAGKLRDALAAQSQGAAPAPLPWPLGFAAGDRPFALQPGPAGDSHEGVNS
ncbi:hypothetical protein ONA91_24480 [Micromonospora sp. DR5-3]|uniref:hypothetical protein n=1 Tax=unclassified Micromonospora TaxID=2617518 RepID=UPI0011DA420C|nr:MULTISPECIES: hypothetical protein [unclassified Micromonospora]MCW3817616.1 hypothetical protein [Micromonospora sp. DR5-3]TYC19614.1 hypothetical protein FXF52_35615 [Micromonospora sp. MP36]